MHENYIKYHTVKQHCRDTAPKPEIKNGDIYLAGLVMQYNCHGPHMVDVSHHACLYAKNCHLITQNESDLLLIGIFW